MLVRVCAWCQRFLGTLETPHAKGAISHGICLACSVRHQWAEPPTLVVCRSRAALLPVLQEMVRGTPAIPVVVDRRQGERRGADAAGAEDRRFSARRCSTPIVVC